MMTALGMGALVVGLFVMAVGAGIGLLLTWVALQERRTKYAVICGAFSLISIWLAASAGFYLDALK